MLNTLKRTLVVTALLAGVVAVLSGCGRKGPLERPTVTVEPTAGDEASPAPVKERRFILDGLLE